MATLVGRDAQVDAVREQLRRVQAGQGRTIVIEGPPGIGKTALLDVIAESGAAAGIRVLRGAAEQLEQRLHFASVGSCLGLDAVDRPAEIESIAAMLRPARDVEAPTAAQLDRTVAAAIVDVVRQWCGSAPVALLLDDLQWSDPASRVVLGRLGAVAEQLPLLLVCARRPFPDDGELAQLLARLQAHGSMAVTLTELDAASVGSLAADLLGGPPGETLVPVLASAAGNPLYVQEMVAALVREGAVAVVSGVAELTADAVPSRLPRSLRGAILQRMNAISAETTEVLRLAALLGGSFSGPELAAIAEVPVLELAGLVQHAVTIGLLVETADRLDFRHDLVRDALVEDLPAGLRQALHAHLGERLAAAGLPVERVAAHLVAGGVLSDRTVRWVLDSVDELITRAGEDATDLLALAVHHAGSTEPLGSALRYQHARALLWTGRVEQALRQVTRALRGNRDPALEGSLQWIHTQACTRAGLLEDAVVNAKNAIATVPLTAVELGRFNSGIAQTSIMLGDTETAETASLRAIEIGGTTPDAYTTATARVALGAVRITEGRFSEALQLCQQSLAAWGGEEPRADTVSGTRMNGGMALLELDRMAEAEQTLEIGLRFTAEHGSIHQSWYRLVRAQVRFAQGRWDEVLAETDAGLSDADHLGLARARRSLDTIISVHRDAPIAEEPSLHPFQKGVSPYYDWLRSWALALALEKAAQPTSALAVYAAAFARRGWANHAMAHHLYPDFVRLAHHAGEPDLIERVRSDTGRRAAATPTARTTGLHHLVCGTADDDPRTLRNAVAAFRSGNHTLLLGYALEQSCVTLATRGETAAATEAFEQAVAAYRSLGAGWDIDRAEGRSYPLGVRRTRDNRRRGNRPLTGWAALTAAEQRVATMVAKAMSNTEIAARLGVSRRTVQAQVSSALHKLGVRSRVEIAVVAAAQQSAEDTEPVVGPRPNR
ncbi:ATP-binding protein [Saccharopolyspora sp. 5N708]|uniref:ATP-binding protein n=1 Tax=Saccharopolyspora sp. 5N708 TaxID=3457424 RepID=UPI003FD5B60A